VEHIKESLERSGRKAPIPGRKITEVEPEINPEEEKERLRKSLMVSSLDNTFSNFKKIAGTKEALTAFKHLASGMTRWKMLLCYGAVGNGKTYLCEATAIELYNQGKFTRVFTMSNLMQILKKSLDRESELHLDYLISVYQRAERLIIDDVGMGGSGSDWEYGQLEDIIGYRYRENLFTIITTNRDLTELPRRIVSRFQDPDRGRVVLNEGKDYREIKEAQDG